MALIHHHQIEKVRAELPVGVLIFVIVGEALIERQIDFIGFIDLLLADHRHGVFEMAKITAFGLVDQGVAVGQKENALFGAAFPQAVDDLKGDIRFAGAGRHDEQPPILPFGNGFHRAVNGDLLIIARRSAGRVKIIVL